MGVNLEFRDRVEDQFEKMGYGICRHPWWVLLGMGCLTVAMLLLGLPRLRIETSFESYLDHTDPARLAYNEFRHQYVYDDFLMVLIEPGDVFTFEFLEKLQRFHEDLENEIPLVDEVTSLVNARVTRGEGDELIVGELLEDWPEDEKSLAELRDRVLQHPLYVNTVVSGDGKTAAVTILVVPGGESLNEEELDFEGAAVEAPVDLTKPPPILESEELTLVMKKLEEIISRYEGEDFPVKLTGMPEMGYSLMKSSQEDMTLFSSLANLLIMALLFLLFRRISGFVLPIIVVILPLMSTFGLMGLLDIPFTPSSNFLPSFLLVVCIGDAVHILTIFYRRFDQGAEKDEAIAYALGHSGLAVVMTSVTTAGGLFSFYFSDLTPLSGLGIAAPAGVIMGLVYSIFLLPALLKLVPVWRKEIRETKEGVIDRLLLGLGDFSTGRPWHVVIIWTLLVGSGFYAACQLRPSHDSMKWFSETHPTRVAAETANRELKGVMSLEMVIDSGQKEGLYEPELLEKIVQVQDFAKELQVGYVVPGQTISLTEIVRETNQALNGNDPDYYVIPEDRALLAQELMLFENSGSDDLSEFVDSQFQKARVSVLVPFEDGFKYIPFVQQLQDGAEEILGEEADVEMTGLVMLFVRTISVMVQSTMKSYTVALLVVIPLMIILIGEFRMGMMSIVPNLAPIIIGLGFMKVVGVPFDMFTMMLGSLAIGVAVDDTIHFMHCFRRYYRKTGNAPQAVHETLSSTGRALLLTSVALSAGFFLQVLGTMNSVSNLGLVTGFTIVVALFADLMLSPALVTLLARYEKDSAFFERTQFPDSNA